MVFQPRIENTVFDLQLFESEVVNLRNCSYGGVTSDLQIVNCVGLGSPTPILLKGQLVFHFSKGFQYESVRYIIVALPRELLDAISLLLRV